MLSRRLMLFQISYSSVAQAQAEKRPEAWKGHGSFEERDRLCSPLYWDNFTDPGGHLLKAFQESKQTQQRNRYSPWRQATSLLLSLRIRPNDVYFISCSWLGACFLFWMNSGYNWCFQSLLFCITGFRRKWAVLYLAATCPRPRACALHTASHLQRGPQSHLGPLLSHKSFSLPTTERRAQQESTWLNAQIWEWDASRFKSWLCRLLAVWSWGRFLNFLSFNLLTHRMRIIKPIHGILFRRLKWQHVPSTIGLICRSPRYIVTTMKGGFPMFYQNGIRNLRVCGSVYGKSGSYITHNWTLRTTVSNPNMRPANKPRSSPRMMDAMHVNTQIT